MRAIVRQCEISEGRMAIQSQSNIHSYTRTHHESHAHIRPHMQPSNLDSHKYMKHSHQTNNTNTQCASVRVAHFLCTYFVPVVDIRRHSASHQRSWHRGNQRGFHFDREYSIWKLNFPNKFTPHYDALMPVLSHIFNPAFVLPADEQINAIDNNIHIHCAIAHGVFLTVDASIPRGNAIACTSSGQATNTNWHQRILLNDTLVRTVHAFIFVKTNFFKIVTQF